MVGYYSPFIQYYIGYTVGIGVVNRGAEKI